MSIYYKNNEFEKASALKGLNFFTICNTVVVSLLNKKKSSKNTYTQGPVFINRPLCHQHQT